MNPTQSNWPDIKRAWELVDRGWSWVLRGAVGWLVSVLVAIVWTPVIVPGFVWLIVCVGQGVRYGVASGRISKQVRRRQQARKAGSS